MGREKEKRSSALPTLFSALLSFFSPNSSFRPSSSLPRGSKSESSLQSLAYFQSWRLCMTSLAITATDLEPERPLISSSVYAFLTQSYFPHPRALVYFAVASYANFFASVVTRLAPPSVRELSFRLQFVFVKMKISHVWGLGFVSS